MPTVETTDRGTANAAPATGTRAEDADIEIATRLAGAKDHPVVRTLGAMTKVGDQPPLFALCSAVVAYGLVAGDRRATLAGARMLGSFLVATWIKGGLKRLVSRTRPNVLLDEGHYEVRPLGPDEGPWHSFPSGHTAGSVAVARAVARAYPEARAPAYGAAAFVALLQIPRGAHYPSDVAAGVLIGLGAEAAVEKLAGYWLTEGDGLGERRHGELSPGRPPAVSAAGRRGGSAARAGRCPPR
jgi:membrane-associated phospholipid phosphatase